MIRDLVPEGDRTIEYVIDINKGPDEMIGAEESEECDDQKPMAATCPSSVERLLNYYVINHQYCLLFLIELRCPVGSLRPALFL